MGLKNADIDALIASLYGAISFSPGSRPDLERLRDCFVPGALLVNTAADPVQIMDVAGFITAYKSQVDAGTITGFQEHEIGRRLDVFGRAAQALSAYGCEFTAGGETQVVRGINVIQMACLAGSWRVVSLSWDVEGPDRPLPEDFRG